MSGAHGQGQGRLSAGAPADGSVAARRAVLRALVAAPGEAGLDAVAARVAGAVAEAEPADVRAHWRARFAEAMREARFLPNLPTLSNAGRSGQLAACFVVEPEDSLDSIYRTLHRAARIQQGSGGCGIHLSRLRPRDAPIEHSGGVSPGPVAFLELFAHSARVNARAGRRPGAHLAVLRDDHPDVLDFVRARLREPEALAGVGLAVGVSDALLEAEARGESHALHDPRDGRSRGSVPARELLEAIAISIHATGDPTLLFLDSIARGNPVPQLGRIEATNPCGEQPLLPGESCVLGSLHLPAFLEEDGTLATTRLADATRDAVRFLDDVIEVNAWPDDAIAHATRRTRKVGLGVMGFADVLLLRGVPYADHEAERLAGEVLGVVAPAAHEATRALAQERDPFPAWRGEGPRRRNAAVLAIAPTGTIRLLAGCSAGLEPFLQPVLRVRTRDGEARWTDRWLEAWLAKRCPDVAEVLEALERESASDALPGLAPPDRELLRRAWEVPAERQIALQARFQRAVDGAVSKTVHVPAHTSPEALLGWIRLAHRSGCKGVAFFRRTAEGASSARGEFDLDLAAACCPL